MANERTGQQESRNNHTRDGHDRGRETDYHSCFQSDEEKYKKKRKSKKRTKDRDEPSDSSSSDDSSDDSHKEGGSPFGKKKSREPDSNEDDNNKFYEYGQEIPDRLTGKTREQFVKLIAQIRETLEKMQETRDSLVKSNEDIENMTSDALITTLKCKETTYSTQISDLDKCRQAMQTLMDMLGGAITMRKKQKCKMIPHNARNTTTNAKECIKSMQSLVDRRQLTQNQIS